MEQKKWDLPLWNILFILLGAIVSFVIGAMADLTGAGMAAIFLHWLPVIIGLAGIIIYLLSRLFFKNYNWIISLLLVLFILTFSTQLHFTNFAH